MCGINGFVTQNSISEKKSIEIINSMNSKILHRGPDDSGIYTHVSNDYSISLGMNRLSIIDLTMGNQPFYSDDKKIILIFNGEIYNYKSLRNELIELFNINFYSDSDTEVILRLYEVFGENCFDKLDGMYAFSIYDRNINKIFICRDYFGEKPLYYHLNKNNFYWASELKSIISVLPNNPQISQKAITTFFQLTYIPAPLTIYKNIFKLQPNQILTLDLNDFSLVKNKIHKEEKPKFQIKSFKKAVVKTHDLVMNSVLSRSVSDVELGTFLSGGVDSSIVSLCLSKQNSGPINTYSISFEKKSFDESEKSRLVSKLIGSNHNEFLVSDKLMNDYSNDVLINYDEPFADSSAIPTYIVSKHASNDLKVVLTGDGGDELFGGYNKYYMGKINRIYTSVFPKFLHEKINQLNNSLIKQKSDERNFNYKLKRLLSSINYEKNFYRNIISLGFSKLELSSLLLNVDDEYFNNSSFFNSNDYYDSIHDFRKIDKHISLEGDLLVKVDRASMLTSLECRSPFLNKTLWDFSDNLPEKFLINGWNKKYILKKAFSKYFPNGFLEKSKKGFAIPVGDWLRTVYKNELLSYSEKDFILKQNIFKYEYINKIIKDHINSRNDSTFKVWSFYCFQKWYTANINL